MVKPIGSDKWRLYSSAYSNYMTTSFQIGKYSCENGMEEVSIEEYREMLRWLNRKGFHEFTIVQPGYEFIYYEGSFNCSPIEFGGHIYGMELTITTNRPYGLGTKQELNYEISESGESFNIYDTSDEMGVLYPDMIIECHANGDFSMHNSIEDRTMLIKNCVAGEILSIFGESKIITTTVPAHAVYNDFNYKFFRLANTDSERNNLITVSLPSKISINYIPIRKVGI